MEITANVLILFIFLIFPCSGDSFLNKSYGEKSYNYNTETGKISKNDHSIKNTYRIGLLLDSPISNPPTTGLLYKVVHLSREMAKRGHSYIFFICNRNFKSKKDLDKFKIKGIKVHIIDEALFYNKSYMSDLIKKEKIDILQYEVAQTFLTLGMPLKTQTGIPSVIVLHDMENELVGALGKGEIKDVVDFTHYVASHLTDALMTLTVIDKEKRIKRHGVPKNKIFVTSVGVDEMLPFKGPNLNEKIIGLVGNQFYEPNRRATLYLIEKILPLVKVKNPDAKVKIIGMCPEELKALYKDRADIIFTGEIKQHDKYIEEMASFSVGTCCIDVGCGMNVKVSNYCALGLPVVLTPICHKGYENIKSLQVVPLDPLKISKEINKILDDKGYSYNLGVKNHKLIFEHLSWNKIAINLEEALHYAFAHKTMPSSSSRIEIKPIWMLENRQNNNMLRGHYIIDK